MGWFGSRNKRKTAEERKRESMKRLRSLGIPVIEHLPVIEEEGEARIRTAQEIAERILVLAHLNLVAEVPKERAEVVEFLKETCLWQAVSPKEQELFGRKLSKQEAIDISWRTECIWVMLWVLGKFPTIELPTEQVEVDELFAFIPELATDHTAFVQTAKLRPVPEILDFSDLTYRLHWAARQADLDGDQRTPLILSAVREQHYAINWITYYAEDWDEVTTDT
ncbi:MAG TPA: DUF4272 domain-containing protein [Flavobacteriales bacterium]|nr:DUF4272 domain-containing protein [Flavobacteriales bacterium]